MGTPEFSVPVLQAVHAAGHDARLVVTRPDARRGRGRRPALTPVKAAALRLGLEVFQPRSVNRPEAVERLRSSGAQIAIVVAYGEMLRAATLRCLPGGMFNLHASLLPKYRGAAPINWALMRGEAETGVTLQRMAPELDAGPVVAQKAVCIGPDETAGGLHDRLSILGAELLVEVLRRLDRGEALQERPQDAAQATLAPKLSKEDGYVDWRRPAAEVRNVVRGLTPWPGAATTVVAGGRAERVILLAVDAEPRAETRAEPGAVLAAGDEQGIVVQASPGSVIIRVLKPSSGRAMTAADFIHGHHVRPGDRFE